MRALTIGALVLGSFLVGGCQSTHYPYDPPKPIDQMTPAEWCDYAKFFLSNPENSAETRKVVIEKMHAKGCTT